MRRGAGSSTTAAAAASWARPGVCGGGMGLMWSRRRAAVLSALLATALLSAYATLRLQQQSGSGSGSGSGGGGSANDLFTADQLRSEARRLRAEVAREDGDNGMVSLNSKHENSAPSENAYAAILYGGTPRDFEFFIATRVMFRSLKSFGTQEDLVALVSPDLPHKWRKILSEEDGVQVIEVEDAPNPYKKQKRYDPRFVHAMNKIWAWGLLDYKRVVLLDADNLFLRNVDELFKCGDFCAAFINPCIFHTGLIVLAPSNDTLNDMLSLAHELESYDGGDQGFLNSYYANLLAAPLFEPDAAAQPNGLFRLPFGYQMDQSYYYQRFQWEVPCSAKSVITFPGMSQLKPWYWWSAPFLQLPYQWHETRRALLGYSAELPAALTGALASIMLALMAVFAKATTTRNNSNINKWVVAWSNSLPHYHQAKPLAFSASVLSAFLLPLWIIPRTMHPIAGWGLYFLHSGCLLVCLHCLSNMKAGVLFFPWAVFATEIALLALPWASNCFQRIAFGIALLCIDAVLAYRVSSSAAATVQGQRLP